MSSWAGKRADDFFATHGAAEKVQRLGDGRTVYVWYKAVPSPTGGELMCSADIVASGQGVITSIRPRVDTIGMWGLSRCGEVF